MTDYQYSAAEVRAIIRAAESSMAAVDKLRAEIAATEAALRVWCADLSKFVAESTDQIVATMTRFEIEDLKEAGLWREPTGGES